MEKFRGCTNNDQHLKVEPGDDDGDDDDDDDDDDNDDDDDDLLNNKCPVSRVE